MGKDRGNEGDRREGGMGSGEDKKVRGGRRGRGGGIVDRWARMVL